MLVHNSRCAAHPDRQPGFARKAKKGDGRLLLPVILRIARSCQWPAAEAPKLAAARQLVLAEGAVVWVSVVSLWETAVKHSLGRGEMPLSAQEAVTFFSASNFRFLNLRPEHAVAVEALPSLHADPFDRLLIAQAQVEPMRLLTHDELVARYSDSIVWV